MNDLSPGSLNAMGFFFLAWGIPLITHVFWPTRRHGASLSYCSVFTQRVLGEYSHANLDVGEI